MAQAPQLSFSLALDTATLVSGNGTVRRLLTAFTAIQDGAGDNPQDLNNFELWCAPLPRDETMNMPCIPKLMLECLFHTMFLTKYLNSLPSASDICSVF